MYAIRSYYADPQLRRLLLYPAELSVHDPIRTLPGKTRGVKRVFGGLTGGLTGWISCGRLGLEAGRDQDIPRFILGS